MNHSWIERRRALHRMAERSNEERRTAAFIARELSTTSPASILEGLGGHGVAAVYEGAEDGETILLRCDMDALPIPQAPGPDASEDPTTSHRCGHDGHMATMLGVADRVAERGVERGRVVLLFQPAEETGDGAAGVIDDARFASIAPDRALAMHNLPGVPLGQVVVRDGSFASASRGMIIELEGASSHAAEPHLGRSPVAAASRIALAIEAAPQKVAALHEGVLTTVVGIDVGGPAFGTSPGTGRLYATLRSHTESAMQRLVEHCESVSRGLASVNGLACDVRWTDVFPATENDPGVVADVERAARDARLDVVRRDVPLAWSEDFGHFTMRGPGALIGLGSGESQPPLHSTDYVFPDELIEPGVRLWCECLAPWLRP